MLATVATSFLSAPQRRRFTMGILRAVRVPQDLRGAGSFEFHCLEGEAQLQRRNRGGRGGDRTPGLIVANDALSQLSYTPTVRIILANARSATKRDSALDCHAGQIPPRIGIYKKTAEARLNMS